MGRGRFGALLALLFVVVAAAAFLGAWSVLDTGEADPPPRPDGAGETSDTTAAPSTTAAPTVTGQLQTPTWVAVVSSAGDQDAATATAQALAAKGHPAGVLHSDDFSSLEAGFWVAFAGPYADHDAAQASLDTLAADGFAGAYVRCVGEAAECRDGGQAANNDS
jgi:cell division septation protein DedD